MSLVSDYNRVAEKGMEHAVFNELFNSEPKQNVEETIVNDPAEWFHVISADPTQAKSVLHSRTGRSYIIQGPPGTGESQTITNLIADFLARGKTILFVCEKRAALDVVYHRLQQNGLAELCCYIHDSQSDKKEFIKDLRGIYEDFLKNKMDLSSISVQRKFVLDRLLENIKLLHQYHQLQRTTTSEAGITTRKLMETLVHLKAHIPIPEKLQGEEIPYYDQWLQYGQAISGLGKALEETGAESELANHPFNNLGPAIIKAENPFSLMDSLVSHSHQSIQQLSEIIAQNGIPPEHASRLENIKNLIQDSVVLETLAQSNNLQLVDAVNTEAKEFERAYRQYKEVQEAYQQAVDKTNKWLNKFDRDEVEQALQLAVKHEKSFFNFLNGDWRRLKKQLKQCYDFSAHHLKPEFSIILKQLQDEYAEQDRLAGTKSALQNQYRINNIDTTYVGIEVLRRKQGDKEVDFLLQHPKSNELVLRLSKLNNSLHQLEIQLKQCLIGFEDKQLTR